MSTLHTFEHLNPNNRELAWKLRGTNSLEGWPQVTSTGYLTSKIYQETCRQSHSKRLPNSYYTSLYKMPMYCLLHCSLHFVRSTHSFHWFWEFWEVTEISAEHTSTCGQAHTAKLPGKLRQHSDRRFRAALVVWCDHPPTRHQQELHNEDIQKISTAVMSRTYINKQLQQLYDVTHAVWTLGFSNNSWSEEMMNLTHTFLSSFLCSQRTLEWSLIHT